MVGGFQLAVRSARPVGDRIPEGTPKGETPVLVYAFNWKKLSISAALGYRCDGERCRLWFQVRPGSYNDERLIAFWRDLKKHLRGWNVHRLLTHERSTLIKP